MIPDCAAYLFRFLIIWSVVCLCSTIPEAFAQQTDTTAVAADTLQNVQPSDPDPETDPQPAVNEPGAPEGAVKFSSSDSLVIRLEDGKQAFLFGQARVDHSSGQLKAGKINMDIDRSQVEASTATPEDTLSQPVLTREQNEIRSARILFNYETNKGKFEAARVQVDEGHLIGSKVKNVSEDVVFIEDGIYSTCPPDYLYYYIKAKKMKVVDQDELFFSNARLYILDIPYPIVFPFGYVPTDIEQKQSGLLTPTYAFQAQSRRGLGLQNLGWFQYFNDYVTGQASGDIYTSGSFYLNSQVQYRNRDKYSGSLNIGYSKERGLEKTDPDYTEEIQKSLSLNHRQTISPYASFSSSIDLRTADYYKRNSYDVDDRAQTNSNSNISYNYKHPENLFTFSSSARLNQNFSNNSTTLQGPGATFSLKTISPFQDNGSSAEQEWYNTINLSYNNRLQTRFEYDPVDADSAEISFFEALASEEKYKQATGDDDYIQAGFQQTAGLRVGQLIPSQFLNVSASVNFNEYWYPSSIRKSFNADSNRVLTEKINGFASARDFNSSLSFSTTVYGISNRSIGNLEGFRHTLRPQISLNYRPDFSNEKWGFFRTVQTDTLGNTRTYSIFEEGILGGPGRGEQRAVSFSLSNVFETKIVKRDSTGEVSEKKLRIIDNLSLSSSYNFAADSLNLNSLSTRFSSNAIEGLSLSGSASFGFYQRDSLGREIDRFYIEDSRKLAQMESFSLSASTSFRGGGRGVEVFTPVYRKRYDPFNQAVFRPVDPRFGYEPISPVQSPWSVNLNFSYRWTYRHGEAARKSAVLNATNITFKLTPKWDFSTRIGYDFIQKELTPSRFSLNRNLECWDLSFELNPFGEFQYYFFRLSVNSSQIQSLFQKLPVLKNLERSSSPTGRGGYGRY